ncbi:class I SAM-dependent methyltransferase [Mycobacterium antarcticum]|uniref:class I SAM-dependent methyltransferase n=1 Tax=Mycolicibacterium sp. TUM20983 TaxID=3023369 RepID=UPI0024E0B687|nr:methyltransferase domain-containing protein [Mycolicibacterium sp. TUM20983]
MDEVVNDPVRDSLHAMWNSVAASWGEHAGHVDARGAVVARAMLDVAELRAGQQVLELACGPGGVGIAAAPIVGPDGAVVLSDFSAEMTAIAAKRASDCGLTNVTSHEVDMEQIPYPDGSFDVVLCRDGLMLVLDPAIAVREARRVLRPGGRAVFAVWGPRQRNPWLGILFDAVTSALGMEVPPPGLPGPFTLDAPGALAALMEPASFGDLEVTEVPAPMHTASFDEWWSVVPSLAGPLAQLLTSIPAEVATEIRIDAKAALAGFATADGYELPGVSIVGVGRR